MSRLRCPDLPPGPLRTLLTELHRLHARAGWPSTRELARGRLFSHTAVHTMFTKPELPKWTVLCPVVERMATAAPLTDVDFTLKHFDRLWDEAERFDGMEPPFFGPPEEPPLGPGPHGDGLHGPQQPGGDRGAAANPPENPGDLERPGLPLLPSLPVPEASRAVLIGSAAYRHLPTLSTVAAGVADLATLLIEHGNFSPSSTSQLIDPAEPQHVLRSIDAAGRAAEDTLLIYFAGHALVSEHGELVLATAGTEPSADYTGVHYDALRRIVAASPASRSLIILDCCFSGRALHAMGSLNGLAEAPSTYVLASTGPDQASFAPPDQTHTAFTGNLVALLRDGLADGPELLDVESVFRELRRRAMSANQPMPSLRSRSGTRPLALGRNAARAALSPTSPELAAQSETTPVPRVRISVLGPARLEIGGEPVRLSPRTRKLLVRLVAAEGTAVSARQLGADLFGEAIDPRNARHARTRLQKTISELRQAVAGDSTSRGADIIHTERTTADGRTETAYRLTLGPGELDYLEFTELVDRALRSSPDSAIAQLSDAIALYRGEPLAEVAGAVAVDSLARRLTELYHDASRELMRFNVDLDRHGAALPLDARPAEEPPDEQAAALALENVRARLRERGADELLRHELPRLRTSVVLLRSDLFTQTDANLVIGCTDTFDMTGDREQIFIPGAGNWPQRLVEHAFAGQPEVLDRQLRRGLRGVPHASTLTVPGTSGRSIRRYPMGTVVPIVGDSRMIFATVCARLDDSLVARVDAAGLRVALENLWAAVARHGPHKPLAMPLIGNGLARTTPPGSAALLGLIVETFIAACTRAAAPTPELRIMLQHDALTSAELDAAEISLTAPDQDGKPLL